MHGGIFQGAARLNNARLMVLGKLLYVINDVMKFLNLTGQKVIKVSGHF